MELKMFVFYCIYAFPFCDSKKEKTFQPQFHLLSSDILNEKCTIIQINIKKKILKAKCTLLPQGSIFNQVQCFLPFSLSFSGPLFHIHSNNVNNNSSGNTTWVRCKIKLVLCRRQIQVWRKHNRIEMNEK